MFVICQYLNVNKTSSEGCGLSTPLWLNKKEENPVKKTIANSEPILHNTI